MLEYTTFERRRVDSQYKDLLKRILEEGIKVDSQQGELALRVVGHQMRFDLRNGFPIITERDLVTPPLRKDNFDASVFSQALGELFAFLAGVHTQQQLERYGCRWWKLWVTPEKCAKRGLQEGDLGPGSYGPAWKSFPTAEAGITFDQIRHLVEQITELPHLRTHFVTPWIPQYIGRGKGKQQKVVVAPCHGWMHVLIDEARRMTLHHFQRSADVPVGLAANMIQYAAFLMMLAKITGCTPHELVYTISDAHIYVNQIPDVEGMLATKSMPFPTVKMNPYPIHLNSFKQSDFVVEDYYPQLERRKIWTPV